MYIQRSYQDENSVVWDAGVVLSFLRPASSHRPAGLQLWQLKGVTVNHSGMQAARPCLFAAVSRPVLVRVCCDVSKRISRCTPKRRMELKLKAAVHVLWQSTTSRSPHRAALPCSADVYEATHKNYCKCMQNTETNTFLH